MSLVRKNRTVYSYQNKEKIGSKFLYKDMEKSNSYQTNFKDSDFSYASLRGAKFRYCNMSECTFKETEFIGTNLHGTKFVNSKFEGAIFNATVVDETNFKGAEFSGCYSIGNLSDAKNFDSTGIEFFERMPSQSEFSTGLIMSVERLRTNDIIRRSQALHLKQGRINTLSLYILSKTYSEEQLIAFFDHFPEMVTTQFYTLSYVKKALNKYYDNFIL